jgi:2-polyprenyl-6-methoxyphenol hydroxylase-like FAD-dependent oxidoreductase
MKALVIGGGIGGVTAGHALSRAGLEVGVYEQAGSIGSISAGWGIHLWNNATRALKEIGLYQKVAAATGPDAVVEYMQVFSHKGRLLANVPLEPSRSVLGADCVGINRADLVPVVADELPDGVLQPGRRCLGFEQDDAGVVARFEDGGEERGDVLVGADGVRSTIRERLFGSGPPRYAGYTIWQGLTTFSADEVPAGYFRLVFGPGQRFGYYRVEDERRLYWFAVANADEGGAEPEGERKPMLLERFDRWPRPIADIVASTPVESTHRRDVYDRDPSPRWGDGRITLLGDAAHAMTFDVGQGAGQSIEDAVVLARLLPQASGDPARALREYERRRQPRAEHMQSFARRLGRFAMWTSTPAIAARVTMTRAVLGNPIARRKFNEDLTYEF